MYEVLLGQKKLSEDTIRQIFAESFKFVRQAEHITLVATVGDANIRFYLTFPSRYATKIPLVLPNINEVSLRKATHSILPLMSMKVA